MKDIAIYKSIYLDEQAGVHLLQYVLSGEVTELYRLDLLNFDVLQFSKYVDGDLLTLQLSEGFLDALCNAWIAHRQSQENETQTHSSE